MSKINIDNSSDQTFWDAQPLSEENLVTWRVPLLLPYTDGLLKDLQHYVTE